jgi:hypothetical protein
MRCRSLGASPTAASQRRRGWRSEMNSDAASALRSVGCAGSSRRDGLGGQRGPGPARRPGGRRRPARGAPPPAAASRRPQAPRRAQAPCCPTAHPRGDPDRPSRRREDAAWAARLPGEAGRRPPSSRSEDLRHGPVCGPRMRGTKPRTQTSSALPLGARRCTKGAESGDTSCPTRTSRAARAPGQDADRVAVAQRRVALVPGVAERVVAVAHVDGALVGDDAVGQALELETIRS